MKRFSVLIGMWLVGLTAAVEITVTSQCSFPIWIETTGNPTLSGGTPRLNPGATVTFPIPSGGWVSGRMWPKIGCDGSGQNCLFGQSSPPCPAGGCQPPADTKVEFTIFSNGQAWYDVSLVDGYSLPAKIVPRQQGGSCVTTDCNLNLNACPQNENNGLGDLRVFRNGQVVACLSPCKKWNYPPPYGFGRPETVSPGVDMCCPTPPISSPQCNAGPVVGTQFVNLVRRNCPSAYSFAYDDDAGLHHCTVSTSFDVTFCPSGSGPGPNPPGPNPPCTQWGWKFYDGYDIVDNDIGNAWAANRNDCQPMCRNNPQCRAYAWSNYDKKCYFKSGASTFTPNGQVYSAVIC